MHRGIPNALKYRHIDSYIAINISMHCGIPNALKYIDSSWICFPRGPEDDLIKVETYRPDNILFLLYIK